MIRKAFIMQLKPGAREEYKKRHSPIWPSLERVLKDHGVSNYSIFLHGEAALFAYAEIESEELWSRIANTAECKEWWLSMKDLMLTNDDNSPVATEMTEVFHLD
jgi:L-rhamnose mutarotase